MQLQPPEGPRLEPVYEEVDWSNWGSHQMDTVTGERLLQNIRSARRVNTECCVVPFARREESGARRVARMASQESHQRLQ